MRDPSYWMGLALAQARHAIDLGEIPVGAVVVDEERDAIVGAGCLVASAFMFRKELRLPAWGANIRMAIATVIVFWCPVEIMARQRLFTEIWIQPEKYVPQMVTILIAFIIVLVYVLWAAFRKPENH